MASFLKQIFQNRPLSTRTHVVSEDIPESPIYSQDSDKTEEIVIDLLYTIYVEIPFEKIVAKYLRQYES